MKTRLICILLAMFCAHVAFALHGCSLPRTEVARQAEELARLRFLNDAIESGAATEMQAYFPEGHAFLLALTALAWSEFHGSLSGEDPATIRLRQEAHRSILICLRLLDSREGRAPFDSELPADHGAFYSGWLLQTQLAAIRTGSESIRASDLFSEATRTCTTLRDAYASSASPYLESYPGLAWPADTVVAINSLAVCEKILGVKTRATVLRWIQQARATADHSGFLPHEVDPRSGSIRQPARGTSAALILRFMPGIDPEWGARQLASFRREFIAIRFGIPGVREHLSGKSFGDIDSGPLLFGVSLSATAAAAGALRLQGAEALAESLERPGEIFSIGVFGRKRFIFGVLPLGDAFLAWSRTTRPRESPTAGDFPAAGSMAAYAWLFTGLSLALFRIALAKGGKRAARRGN
ncbi:MAG: hypothetical protein NXI24_24320 [bacterium]|nr:hypothetical protein [bacterium]